jgi:hypothetical protein
MQAQLYSSLLGQLAEMPAFFRRTLAGLPREALLRQPENDKSHLLEHLWHTLDCDTDLYGLRIRRILAEDRPTLEPVDVGLWPEARAYASREGDAAIAEFEQERAALIRELSALDSQSLTRVGIRADGAELSVFGVIGQLAAHDQDHRWRVTAILRSFAGLHAPAA